MRVLVKNGPPCNATGSCYTCRNREAGRPWRISLGKVFELPPGAPDFSCPHGKPWGYQPPPEARGVLNPTLTPTQAASVQPGASAGPSRPVPADNDLDAWELCDSCDNQVWISGSPRGCKLLENGTPCALGKCWRGEWPWPDGCPRGIK
jgi:hypothetical protein